MSWTSGDHFAVDPSESQIAEGIASVLPGNNSHRNCLVATAAFMIMAAGGPDIDPQQIINDIWGPQHAAGSDWPDVIRWINANVPGFDFTYTDGFSFDLAEAAGKGGLLVGISGWVDSGPLFNPIGEINGLSHASVLWAHQDDDTFVIWNIWKGRFETYSRDLIAASLYETAVLTNWPGRIKPIPVTTGGSDSSMAILARPLEKGIYDVLFIDKEGYVRHASGAIPAIGTVAPISRGAPANGAAAGSLSATWSTDGSLLCIQVADTLGEPWIKVIDPNAGTEAFAWFALQGVQAQVPRGPAGPPGAGADPAAVASHLKVVAV